MGVGTITTVPKCASEQLRCSLLSHFLTFSCPACWHAYRDVLAELFERFPRATVRTALAVYRGREGFTQHYPATAYANVGSQMQPRHMPELCDC